MSPKGCPDCDARVAAGRRWTASAIRQIRTTLECHALGAEVIALKDPKYERLAALHCLEQLQRIEQVLRENDLLDVPEPSIIGGAG